VDVARLCAHVKLLRGGEDGILEVLRGEEALGLEAADDLFGDGED
jgi:hypothetical protein